MDNPTARRNRTVDIMNIFKKREIIEALRSLFNPAYTNDFPAQPHTPFPRYRGKPVPSESGCIGCGACAEVCPSRAIDVTNDTVIRPAQRKVTWHYDQCIFCGQCERICTTREGVRLSIEYDLATFDRMTLVSGVVKELVQCEACGEIIAPRAQLQWLLRRLGPLASGNYTLLHEMNRGLGLAPAHHHLSAADQPDRQSLYRVHCPRCRHRVLVLDQTGTRS